MDYLFRAGGIVFLARYCRSWPVFCESLKLSEVASQAISVAFEAGNIPFLTFCVTRMTRLENLIRLYSFITLDLNVITGIDLVHPFSDLNMNALYNMARREDLAKARDLRVLRMSRDRTFYRQFDPQLTLLGTSLRAGDYHGNLDTALAAACPKGDF